VKVGDRVKQGHQIAQVADGPPSWSTPHCHMGTHKGPA
jgi:murein DD-endopeptidase MepM/ murein hydrolase activator NlpD